MEKDTILVPWDFTEKAECALEHAVKIAKHLKNGIGLIHVVKSLKKAEDIDKKLDADIAKFSEHYGMNLQPIILEGSLFHEISDYASANNVSIVVMGTHGIKGMQKLTGSYALKVIVGSKIPYIVVQDRPSKKEVFKDVVLSIDYRNEDKQILSWALFLVKYFNVKLHLIKVKHKDTSLAKKVNMNIHFAEKILEKYEVGYNIHDADSSNVGSSLIKYSKEIDADIVLIMTTKDIGLADYVLGAQEQYIIANDAKLPVMVVNPRTDLSKYGGFSASGG